MLRERFKPLFGKALIEAAEWRLKQADKDAPGGESRPGRDSAVAGREGVAREAPQETEQETTPDNSATVSLLDYVREGFRRLEARLDQIAAELVDVRRDMADMKVDTAKRETRIVVWVAGLIGLAVAILSLTLK